MAFEIFKAYEDDQYGKGIMLQEYNGTYSVIAAGKGQNDVIYKKWGFPSGKDKKPISQVLPWQVKLGDSKREALETLRYLMDQLNGF